MARNFIIIGMLVLFSISTAGSAFALTSWESLNSPKQWRKYAAHRGLYEAELTKKLTIRFKRSAIWPRQPFEFGGPLYDNGKIYVGVREKMFYCVDTHPRRKHWFKETIGEVETIPAVSETAVFVGDNDGYVYSWDKNTGNELWQASLEEPAASSPVIEGDVLYIISATGRLFALDIKNGNELWHTAPRERAIGFSVHTSPAPIISENNIYFGTPKGTIASYSKSGELLWETLVGDELAEVTDVTGLITDNKRLFASIADGKIAAIDIDNGQSLWRFPLDGSYSCVLSSDEELFCSGTKKLVSLDAENGLPKWEHEFDTVGLSAPTLGKNFIAISSTKKQMFFVAPENGELMLVRYYRGGSFATPLAKGDTLYFLSNPSRLYTFTIHRKLRKKHRHAKKEGKSK